MLIRSLNSASSLVAFATIALAPACGGDDTAMNARGGAPDSGGTGGSTGEGGASDRRDAASGGGGAAGVEARDAGRDISAGGGGSAGIGGSVGAGGAPVIDVVIPKPDGADGVSYNFDVNDVLGWHYAPYGSTTVTAAPAPTPPADPGNLANRAAAVAPLGWIADDAESRNDASGSLKSLVPFVTSSERIDMQAFSTGNAVRDWAGYIVTAKVKLVSSGVSLACPTFTACLYISSAPSYATGTSIPVTLVPDTWVTLTYDMATAPIDVTQINQMGVQITNGPCDFEAGSPVADAGSTSDAGTTSDAGIGDVAVSIDAGTTDAGPSDSAGTDSGLADTSVGEASTDADASPVIPSTMILIDSVIVSVAP